MICENCGKDTIDAREIPAGKLWKRGFTGKKGYQGTPARTIFLTQACPNCGHKPGSETALDHDAIIKRLQEQGLPTWIGEEL